MTQMCWTTASEVDRDAEVLRTQYPHRVWDVWQKGLDYVVCDSVFRDTMHSLKWDVVSLGEKRHDKAATKTTVHKEGSNA